MPSSPAVGALPHAVVVNTYGDDRLSLVRTTLATLRRTVDWDRARLIVIDTAGSERKRRDLLPLADVLECVDDPEHGEGAGWNLGVRRALDLGASHVALVNDDVCLHRFGWLEECVAKLDRWPELAVMTPLGEPVNGRLSHPLDVGDLAQGHHNVGKLHGDVWIRNGAPLQVWVLRRDTWERFGPMREVPRREQKAWVADASPARGAEVRMRQAGLSFGATDQPSAEHTGVPPAPSLWQHRGARPAAAPPTRECQRRQALADAHAGEAAAGIGEDGADAATTVRVRQVELTNRCPFTCVMCPRREMTRPLGDMEPGLFQSIVDQIGDNQGELLHLHHVGESVLHPRFGALVRYAALRGVRTHVGCNPGALTARKIEELLESGLSAITFAVDGMSDAVLQAIRGPAADVAAAKQNVDQFLRRRAETQSPIEVAIEMIDMKQNRAEQQEFTRWFGRYAAMGARVAIRAFDTWNHPEQAALGGRLVAGRCTRPFDDMTVLWDGRVVPCDHDQDGFVVLGDARTQRLADIWHGAEYARFRAGWLQHPFCSTCSRRGAPEVRP